MAVRRVRRIVRRIDPWTVLKVSLVFNAIAALMFVLGTWVIWSLSLQRGIPERIVEIFARVTLTLTIDGELYFRVVVLLAVVGAIVMTGLFTLGAVLYNLIADLVGGIEITVLEETYNTQGNRTVLRPVVRTPVAATEGAEAEPPDEALTEEDAEPEVPDPSEVEEPVVEEPQPDIEPAGDPIGDDPAVTEQDEPMAVPVASEAATNGDARKEVGVPDQDGDAEDLPDPVRAG